MDIVELHRRSAERFRICLDQVHADQWELATPCPEWDVRALVDHVTANHEQMARRLHGRPIEGPADGPVAAWSRACAAVQSGLLLPQALERSAPSPFGGQAKVGDLARVLAVDLITHTWDLARAVGADDTLDAEVVAVVLPVVELIGPLLSASGKFGSPISVPETESAQRRLLGLLGRAPASV